MNVSDPTIPGPEPDRPPAVGGEPAGPAPTLDQILDGLDDTEEMVVRARESLDEAIRGLKLTPEEERALAGELAQLRDLIQRLDEGTVEIAAFGMVSRGKSSVLNALLGREVFQTGATHGTTKVKAAQRWEGVAPSASAFGGARLILVDTPGIDEVGGEAREALARDVARRADVILFVVSGDILRIEFEALERLREAQKPILLVFNQIDRYPEAERDQIHAKIASERVRTLVRPEDVILTAANPEPYRVKVRNADGTTTMTWERPEPIIEPLKERILQVLEREGKALVALNTLLIAGDLHEQIVRHKVEIREEAANKLIWNFSLAKGAAVAINPVPVADMAGGLAVDVAMIVALSRLYGIPLTKRTAVGLVKDVVKALGALGAVEVATRLIAKGVQASLAGITVLSGGLALPLTALGYAAIGLAHGGTAATTSYVLGHSAKVYLAQGCQWGPKGIKTTVQQILVQARTDSVIERLRDDLRERVGARK